MFAYWAHYNTSIWPTGEAKLPDAMRSEKTFHRLLEWAATMSAWYQVHRELLEARVTKHGRGVLSVLSVLSVLWWLSCPSARAVRACRSAPSPYSPPASRCTPTSG